MLTAKKVLAAKHDPCQACGMAKLSSPAAQLGSQGGKARARNLTKKRIREIATKGARARWGVKCPTCGNRDPLNRPTLNCPTCSGRGMAK